MLLGSKMRVARKLAGKTQQQVADDLGVTKGAVSQWENGQTIPEMEYFKAFCVFTGASADDILLEQRMDPLLRQLVSIWERLTQDGRDSLLGNANRILTEEHPEPGDHNPFGSIPPSSKAPRSGAKEARKRRLS